MIAKKYIYISLFAVNASSIQAMQSTHISQKNFSNLALGQSAALCFFGAITNNLGTDLYNSIGYKERDAYKRSMSVLLKGSGKGSVGLGLLSAIYIVISKYKITQR